MKYQISKDCENWESVEARHPQSAGRMGIFEWKVFSVYVQSIDGKHNWFVEICDEDVVTRMSRCEV
jgi:capsid portal protein